MQRLFLAFFDKSFQFCQVAPTWPPECSWLFALYSPTMFGMTDEDKRKETGALLIAACIIAAIRLRGEPIKPSPKLSATIYDSVPLATLVLRQIQNRHD